MITKNADGTYTVAGMVKCLSEEAALALLEDTGTHGLIDPLTIEANRRVGPVYGCRTVRDECSGMPRVELTMEYAA